MIWVQGLDDESVVVAFTDFEVDNPVELIKIHSEATPHEERCIRHYRPPCGPRRTVTLQIQTRRPIYCLRRVKIVASVRGRLKQQLCWKRPCCVEDVGGVPVPWFRDLAGRINGWDVAGSRSTPTRAVQFCSRTAAAALSPIMMQDAFVLPLTTVGMIDASATLTRARPRTRSRSSTTDMVSVPILHVPAK